jgi:hypothetical protein
MLKEPEFDATNEYQQIITANEQGNQKLQAQMKRVVDLLRGILTKLGAPVDGNEGVPKLLREIRRRLLAPRM